MKFFSVATLTAVLIPAGIIVTALGFWVAVPDARTGLQVVGIGTLAFAAWQSQRLVDDCQKMLDES